jgi:dTDP-4-amino-4,6-dideoxygalactose transaminase
VPLYKQEAFARFVSEDLRLRVTEKLCDSVLSLPIHTEMTEEVLTKIINGVRSFFEKD